jgi:hypothetical protein
MNHLRKKLDYKDYCQYLLSAPGNYTLTYYAEHVAGLSHDKVNRLLKKIQLPPRTLWTEVEDELIASPNGYIVFDDTVLDKRYAQNIDGVRSQYSGNVHSIIRGIGIVTCIYVNPDLDEFWAIDWRVFDPEKDGKSKNDHVKEMLYNAHHHKKLSYRGVLMDTWYASKDLMLTIEGYGKIYYCPLKTNRLVDDSKKTLPYRPVGKLSWTQTELKEGKLIKIKDFPKDHKVKLFRVPVSPIRTDFIVTNDNTCTTSDEARNVCAVRWKIEQLHREIKQTCGIERCQCRIGRIQRNHIACAFLVWNRLKSLSRKANTTIYQVKQSLLSSYLTHELLLPSISYAA